MFKTWVCLDWYGNQSDWDKCWFLYIRNLRGEYNRLYLKLKTGFDCCVPTGLIGSSGHDWRRPHRVPGQMSEGLGVGIIKIKMVLPSLPPA